MPKIKIRGVKVYYEKKGVGEPLVFLHCWTGNHSFWKDQVRVFSKEYKCIAVDFPGHGRSEEIEEYTPEEFSKYIYTLLSKLRIKEATLVGHSLGGMTALKLALEHPQIVKALILIDTSAKLTRYIFQNVSSFGGVIFGHFLPPLIKKGVIDVSAIHPLTSLKIREQIKDEVIKVPNRIVVKVLSGIRAFDVLSRLEEIDKPTLIMVGDLDIFTDLRHAWTLHKGIKSSSLKIIKGAGHMSILEQPEQVNKAMREFMDAGYP